jgi:hypothetical protein
MIEAGITCKAFGHTSFVPCRCSPRVAFVARLYASRDFED